MKAKHVAIGLVWAASVLGVGLWAQAPASLTGTIKDSQGGVIPGARVELIDELRAVRGMSSVTNASGTFVLSNVAPATYTVEVTMPGFRSQRRSGITVNGGDLLVVPDLTLEVAGQTGPGPRSAGPDANGPLVTGDDIGFQPVHSPNASRSTVAGRWMVRINGTWYEASGITQIVPAR